MKCHHILFSIVLVALLFNLAMSLVSWYMGAQVPHTTVVLTNLTALVLLMAWRAASRGL